MKKKIGVVFLVLGLVLIFSAAALLIYNDNESKKAEEQAQVIVQAIKAEAEKSQLEATEADPFDTEMKVVEIQGYGYIGYVTIPDLNLELPVMDKWDYGRLKISPCRYYGSVKTDNLVIAAHNYKSHFKHLNKLKPGSLVMFTDMDGANYTYTVTTIEKLKPTAVEKVKDTGDDLILYTCVYSGTDRIVVRCSKTEK